MKRKLSFKLLGMPYEAAVALSYLFLAILWIFFSDRALAALVPDPEQFVALSLYKGWCYVGVTALLLYGVLHHIFQHIRLAQKDLFESETRYRILIENQTDLVVKIDLDGYFLFVSPSCSELFGKPEDILLGQPFMGLVHEGDHASIKIAWKTLFKAPHKAYVEQRTVTAKGLRWLAWQYTGQLDAEGSVLSIVGVGRDITERKESEDALRESESKLLEAQQIAKIGRWDLDFVSNKLEWSDEIYALLEISREDYSPAYETMLSFIHPDDRERLDQVFQKARENKTNYELEHRMLMPDGRIKWVSELGRFEYDDLGVPFKGFGTAQDITERKLAEQALSESEKNFEAITNQSTLGITVADLEGLYTFVNPAFCEMMGYSSEELLQKSVFDVKAKGQDHGTFDRTKNSEEGIPVQVVLVRKDGIEFVAEVVGKVVSISGEQRVLGIVSDITRRQQAEDALRDNETKYRELAENTAAILWEYDASADRWTYIAPQVEQLLGYAPEEWTNFEFWASCLHEEDREWAVKFCGDCSGRGEAHDFEYRFLKKNGEVIWLRDIVDVELKDGGSVVLRGLLIDITERKQAEIALKLTQHQLEATLDAIPDLLFEMGLDSEIYDYHSPRTDLLFISPENFIGKKMTEVLPADAATVVMEALTEAHAQGRSSGKQYPLILDQSMRWFEISISSKSHVEGDAPRFIAISRDITQRKQAEQAYYESEAKYRTFFENSSEAMLIIENGEFVNCNNATVAMLGYDRKEELVHIHPAKLSPEFQPDGRPSVEKAEDMMQQAVSQGHLLFMWDHMRKDGTVFPVEVSLTAIGLGEKMILHTVWRDMTEYQRAEEEKERLLAAINQASETVVITDAEGAIQYVNPAFEKVSGYTREEVIGENPRLLKSDGQDDAFYRAMWEILVAGETWSGRFTNRKKDGSLYTEEATISPVKNATGETVNYVAIKADITTTLAWEAQYRQTQKLESVGRLAGGVAHDFNNILQTITGFCGLILSEMDAQSAQRQDVIEIQKATHLAGELTQQLLAFSRKQPTQYKIIDLNTILSSGKKMLQQALDEDTHLQFKLEDDLKQIYVDSSQILQVAMNLMVNARDAMPNGGTILVDTKNIKIEDEDLSKDPNSRVGEFVCLTVSDTGCGMDAQQLSHLFEPFYTTKPVGQGTGLGLSVVYGIVKEHSGWISVFSEPESGSVFQVYLPVHDGVHTDLDPCKREAFDGKRILLVADDSVVRQLTGEILQDMGYVVSAVENSIEAEEAMLLKGGAFDLLFSKRVLPEQSGIELAESCLKHNSGIAVLLFGEESKQHAEVKPIIEKGFNYIQTPFNLNKLLRVVERSIVEWRKSGG